MSNRKKCEKYKIAVIEDYDLIRNNLSFVIKQISDKIECRIVSNASQALEMFKIWRPDIITLDIMLPYGKEGRAALDPDELDHEQVETGYKLLEYIKDSKRSGLPGNYSTIWVIAVTGRSDINFLRKLRNLIGSKGTIYLKPFNSLTIKNDIVCLLGLECNIPADLLPQDYLPPTEKLEIVK